MLQETKDVNNEENDEETLPNTVRNNKLQSDVIKKDNATKTCFYLYFKQDLDRIKTQILTENSNAECLKQ